MRDYSNLTDAEINAKLAEKMGWVHRIFFGDERWWVGDKPGRDYDNWSPCTRRDDLAVVLIEVRKRVLDDDLDEVLFSRYSEQWAYTGPFQWFYLLICPQRIIAEACLEVLEG